MAKTRTEKINSIQDEIKQLENQRKRLLQAQREQERKDRTRRLCKRAGLLESMLPDTIPLTDELFKSFLEKTVTTEQSRRILDGLTAQGNATAAPIRASAAARPTPAPASQPAQTEQDGATDEGQDGGNGEVVRG